MGYILLFGGMLSIVFGLNYIQDYSTIGIMLMLIGFILMCLGIVEEKGK